MRYTDKCRLTCLTNARGSSNNEQWLACICPTSSFHPEWRQLSTTSFGTTQPTIEAEYGSDINTRNGRALFERDARWELYSIDISNLNDATALEQ